MSIVTAHRNEKSPSGAACLTHMALLRSFNFFVGSHYKHAAPLRLRNPISSLLQRQWRRQRHDVSGNARPTTKLPRYFAEPANESPSPLNGERAGVRGETAERCA